MPRASVRRQVRIDRSAADVWAVVGDAARLGEWFPGLAAVEVDGDLRTITTRSGVQMPERIVTCDPVARRFQYRIEGPLFREHLSTIDVFELDGRSCLVAYACDADPATMALIIAGAATNGLHGLRQHLEGDG